MESNAENQAGVVQIVLGAGTYDLTIPPTGDDDASSGDLNITSQIQIVGAGAATTTIDAQQLDRIFEVDPGASLNLSGVTLVNGLDNTSTIGGGAIAVNGGTLTLSNDVFSSNQATGSADDFGGGARRRQLDRDDYRIDLLEQLHIGVRRSHSDGQQRRDD